MTTTSEYTERTYPELRAKSRVLVFSYPVDRVVREMVPGTVKLTREIKQAMRDWLNNACNVVEGGNYKLKSNRRAFAPWNNAVRAAFPDCSALHAAAHLARDRGLV